MKIIIAGVGKVGSILAKKLAAENHDVTIIDQDPDVIEELVNVCDIMGVCGNAGSYSVQQEAGSQGADLLIATTSGDELNILACLVAKKLGVRHTIARVRNPEYEKQLRFMRDELGLSMAINPEKATAREISRVLRFPSALKVDTFAKGRIELVEYRIGENSPLAGVQLTDLYRNTRAKVLICAVARGEDVVIPSGEFLLQKGDKIYVTASPQALEACFRHLGVFRARAKAVMIVGASKICYYLASELANTDMSVKIIDSDEDKCVAMSERLPQALLIQGDGTDAELLQEEGLGRADAFVALTGLDEANIIMGMYAAKSGVGKVVVKVNRQSFVDLVASGSMTDSIVSTGTVTSELILRYVRAMRGGAAASQVKTLHRVADDRVEALEFGVPEGSPLIGIPFKDLPLKNDLLVAGIARLGGEIVIPSGQDSLRPGDSVTIVTTHTTLRELSDILKK